jgi:hypothetical protein
VETNLQLFPSPMFYNGGREFNHLSDRSNSAASLVSAFAMNSTTYALHESTPIHTNFLHGGIIAPAFLRAVFVCTGLDVNTGIQPPQEFNIEEVYDQMRQSCPASVLADGTRIFVNFGNTAGGDCGMTVNGGVGTNLTSFENFSLKIYWQ